MDFITGLNFTMSLKVNEIYFSIQGESTHAGRPCIFIRLTYCNLRCTYCDTEYAFYEGKDMEISEIITKIQKWSCNIVEVTGGEPLFQEECIPLLKALMKQKYTVMLETGGSIPISDVPIDVIKIVDFKCPSSGMIKKNLWSIVNDLQPHDEVKFIIGDRKDFNWASEMIDKYTLNKKCTILFSPTFGEIKPNTIVEWILEENLPVRLQLQIHKHIWSKDEIGV